MSSSSEAGAREPVDTDDPSDWTFLDDRKDISKVEDVNETENVISSNPEEEEEDVQQQAAKITPKADIDCEHSDGISVLSETSTHRALDELWEHAEFLQEHCDDRLQLPSTPPPAQMFAPSNIIFMGGIVALLAMALSNLMRTDSIATPIDHSHNTSLLAQRVDLLELENEALRILVDKLMERNGKPAPLPPFKEPKDMRKTKKIKVWSGEGNTVERVFIEKHHKKHVDVCNYESNSDDLYAEYRQHQCELKNLSERLGENKIQIDKTGPKRGKRSGTSPKPDAKPEISVKRRKDDSNERMETKRTKSKFDKTSKYNDKLSEENLRMRGKHEKELYSDWAPNEHKTNPKRDKRTEKLFKNSGDKTWSPRNRSNDKHFRDNIAEEKLPTYR